MVNLIRSQSFVRTRRYRTISVGDLDLSAAYLFASDSTEPRGELALWKQLPTAGVADCAAIVAQRDQEIDVLIGSAQAQELVELRDDERIASLLPREKIILDISGLAHHVWAPILRVALQRGRKVSVVYVEPDSYRPHPSPASPTVFDLSSGFGGLAPLPGLARLAGPDDDAKTLLVAFLGFEGNRAQHIALSLDPIPKTIPVVGVPGFRLEYPAFTIACNRDFLADHRAHSEIRWARASCPFEAYEVLSQLRVDYPDYYFYIAPIGTKPHALGAVHYAIDHPVGTEILYDHPNRKPGRTQGVGTVHVYEMKG